MGACSGETTTWPSFTRVSGKPGVVWYPRLLPASPSKAWMSSLIGTLGSHTPGVPLPLFKHWGWFWFASDCAASWHGLAFLALQPVLFHCDKASAVSSCVQLCAYSCLCAGAETDTRAQACMHTCTLQGSPVLHLLPSHLWLLGETTRGLRWQRC